MNDNIRITEIKQSDKDSLFMVYSQNGFEFSLSAKGLFDTGIRLDRVFSVDEFEKLRIYALEEKVYRHAIYFLGYRDYSVGELLAKLAKNGEDGIRAVERLVSQGYIDDNAYSLKIIEKYSCRYGPGRVREELKKRKLSKELWEDKLSAAYLDSGEAIRAKIESKLRGSMPAGKKEKDKLFMYLVRQGYDYDDIKNAIVAYSNDFEE